MAKELQVPIIALAQLNREVDREGGRPKLSDLRESGSIEQDSDTVGFIWSDDPMPVGERIKVKYTIAKNRTGCVGECEVIFNRAVTRFESEPICAE